MAARAVVWMAQHTRTDKRLLKGLRRKRLVWHPHYGLHGTKQKHSLGRSQSKGVDFFLILICALHKEYSIDCTKPAAVSSSRCSRHKMTYLAATSANLFTPFQQEPQMHQAG